MSCAFCGSDKTSRVHTLRLTTGREKSRQLVGAKRVDPTMVRSTFTVQYDDIHSFEGSARRRQNRRPKEVFYKSVCLVSGRDLIIRGKFVKVRIEIVWSGNQQELTLAQSDLELTDIAGKKYKAGVFPTNPSSGGRKTTIEEIAFVVPESVQAKTFRHRQGWFQTLGGC